MEKVVVCPVCGSRSLRRWRRLDGWMLRRCRECELIFVSPRPTPAELDAMYSRDYFETFDMKEPVDEAGIAKQAERVHIVGQFKREGRLLDIGCGNGYFLEGARRAGFDVSGLDVSDWAARYCRDTFGIDVAGCDVHAADFPDAAFDVVTLWHNLEHQRYPVDALKRVAKWLAPDGVVLVRVPNIRSFDAVSLRTQWHGLSLPYHLVHFTPDTLREALRRAGLKPVWWDLRLPQFAVNALARRRRQKTRVSAARHRPPRDPAPTHVVQRGPKARVLKTVAKALPGRDITVAAVRRER